MLPKYSILDSVRLGSEYAPDFKILYGLFPFLSIKKFLEKGSDIKKNIRINRDTNV